jgi:hypothetical protein
MRGRVCSFQLLLDFVSTVFLGSESRGAHEHISLSQFLDSPTLEDQVPVCIYPRNRVAQLILPPPRHWVHCNNYSYLIFI